MYITSKRLLEENSHLEDLISLLTIFADDEDGDDPQLQGLYVELKEKRNTTDKLVHNMAKKFFNI